MELYIRKMPDKTMLRTSECSVLHVYKKIVIYSLIIDHFFIYHLTLQGLEAKINVSQEVIPRAFFVVHPWIQEAWVLFFLNGFFNFMMCDLGSLIRFHASIVLENVWYKLSF